MRLLFHQHFRRHVLRLVCVLALRFCGHSCCYNYYSPWVRVSADAAFVQRHYPSQTTTLYRDLVTRRERRIRSESYRCYSFRPNNVADSSVESSSTALQNNSRKSRLGRRLIPPHVLEELASCHVQFPYTCELLSNYDVPKKSLFWKPQNLQQQNEEESVNIKNNNNVIRMTIRLLQANDIQTVTDMCCQEYGVGNVALNLPKTLTAAIQDADFKALNRLAQDLFDEFVLRLHVDWTMRLKVQVPPPISYITTSPNNNGNTLMAQQQQQQQQHPPPPDHAVLLLTLSDATYNNHQYEEDSQEAVVGIVEVSQQPPIPERNPPAFPIPLVVKKMYCWWWSVLQQQKQQQQRRPSFTKSNNNKAALMTRRMNNMIIKPEGWITNVLVAPEFRGQGWAKVLVHACEGVARSWNVSAIQLHCDANSVSGRVAQQLYTSMGYQDSCIDNNNNNTEYESSPASSSSSEYDWMKLAAQAEAAAVTGLWSSSSSSSSTTDTVYPTTEPVMCSSSVYVIEGVPLLYLKKDLV